MDTQSMYFAVMQFPVWLTLYCFGLQCAVHVPTFAEDSFTNILKHGETSLK